MSASDTVLEDIAVTDGFSLFRGVSIVIDDRVHDREVSLDETAEAQAEQPDEILNVLQALREQKLPVLKMDKLPEDDIIRHLGAINFILLDWELHGAQAPTLPGLSVGLNLGSTLAEDSKIALCEFIQEVLDHTYCPVFIFSNVATKTIKAELVKLELGPAIDKRILVARKNEVDTQDKLRAVINHWTKDNPSFLCLKAWENSFNEAKANTFIDLTRVEKNWPRLFWKAFKADKIHPWPALAEVISRNVAGRADLSAHHLELNELIDEKDLKKDPGVSRDTVAAIVASAECTPINARIHPPFAPGDVFKDGNEAWWVNIRPVCDIAHVVTTPDPELYLVRVEIIEADTDIASWNNNGVINHPHTTRHLVPYIPLGDRTRFVRVHFDKLLIAKSSTLRPVTRLLAPRATELAQRYGFYIAQCGTHADELHVGALVRYDEKLFVNIRPFHAIDNISKELHLLSVERVPLAENLVDGVLTQKSDLCHILPEAAFQRKETAVKILFKRLQTLFRFPKLEAQSEATSLKVLFKQLRTVPLQEAELIGEASTAKFHDLLLRYGFYLSRAGVMRIPGHSKTAASPVIAPKAPP